MTTKIIEITKPRVRNPIFIEGLPGVGNVGRIAGGYLVEELNAKKFAELYSSHFMPFVLLQQGATVHVLKNEFYYWKAKTAKQRDLIILIGDSQSIDAVGHYDVVDKILDYVATFKVKDIFTLAGLSVGEKKEKPGVVGAVSDHSLVKKYSKYGIDFESGENVGTIMGASGLIIGMGKMRGMDGVCLLGETSGMPLLPDPKASEEVLKVLTKILGIRLDTSKIKEKVKEMEKLIKRVETIQRKAILDLMKQRLPKPGKEEEEGEEEGEELTYIG